jgi:peptidoglycan/LPS O-acetylase OafA/YrhL
LVQYDPENGHFSPLFSFGTPKLGNWIGYNLAVLGQAWSLSIELLFYAMAPLLLKLRTRWLCLILLFSLCIKIYIASFGVYNTFWIDAFYPAELMFFLSGAVAFRIYHSLSGGGRWFLVSSRMVSGLAILGFLCAVAGYGKNTNLITSHWFTIYFAVTSITAFILPFVFHASKSNNLDRWLGNLSYPMYLSHLTVVQVMKGLLQIDSLVSIVTVTVATSIAGYCLIDRPVDKLRHAIFPIRQPHSGLVKGTVANPGGRQGNSRRS